MTLEECIDYAENQSEWMSKYAMIDIYKDRSEYYRQLAKWLRELVHLRNITEYLRDMVTCFEFMDSMHYNEDIIEWAESELRVDMREVNADDDNM